MNEKDLKIGTSQTLGTHILPNILTIFAKTYPQIKLKIYVNSTRTIIKNILNQKIDIGIIGGKIPNKLKKNLKIEQFAEDELNLIIPNYHKFRKKEKLKKNDLYQLNFITLNSSSITKKFIDKILQFNKIETKKLKTVIQLNSIEKIKTAVSLGLGVAFISSSFIEKELKLNTIRILKIDTIDIKLTLSILTNSNYNNSNSLNKFSTHLAIIKK